MVKRLSLRWFVLLFLVVNGHWLLAQAERKIIREGNQQYEEKKFNESEISYRKGIEKNKSSVEGTFNLGDALYKQGKYEEAVEQFSRTVSGSENPKIKSQAFHNLGNSYLQQKKYNESIDAYKNSLKISPGDKETQYNLAYAKSMLRQQQQQQQQQNQDQNQDQDKKDNKEQKGQDQQKEKQDQAKKDQQKSGQEQKGEKQEGKEAKPKEQKISKEDAERILQALKNEEREVQKRLNQKETKRGNIEKDW